MDSTSQNGYSRLIKPWIVWFICSLFYSHQYFSRVSVKTYAFSWTTQFSLSPVQLGFLAASFMYVYLFMQPIAGILINRFGVKLILLLAAFVATVGCFVLSFAGSYHELLFARMLLGLGGAFSLVSIVNICNITFDKKKFAIANGLTFTLGGVGAIFAGTPLALLISQTNWKVASNVAGVFCLVISILLVFLIKNINLYLSNKVVHADSWKVTAQTFIKTVKVWRLWGPCLYSAFVFLPMIVLATLWLEPLLITEYHKNNIWINLISSVEFAGYIIGAPLLAMIFNKTKNKATLLTLSSLILFILCLLIIYDNSLPLAYMSVIIFAFGFFSSVALLSIPIIRASLPAEQLTIAFGISVFSLNFAGVSFLPILGWSLERYDHLTNPVLSMSAHFFKFSLFDYHHSFVFLPVSLFFAFIISFMIKVPE